MTPKKPKLPLKVRDRLRDIGARHGLGPRDIETAENGITLSPAAKRVWNVSVECQCELTNFDHLGKPGQSIPVLVHDSTPFVTVRFEDFVALLNRATETRLSVLRSVQKFNDHIFGPENAK